MSGSAGSEREESVNKVSKQKGQKPRAGTELAAALDYVTSHPNCRTSFIARDLGWTQRYTRARLRTLLGRGLIGMQASPLFGEFESTWLAERD